VTEGESWRAEVGCGHRRPDPATNGRISADEVVGTGEGLRWQRRVEGLAGPVDGLGGLINGFFLID
jgi:hypothetical protein